MRLRIFGLQQGHLHDGDIQGVVVGIKENFEGEPDAVVKASGDGFRGDIFGTEKREDLGG